jgi:hypothetical protein
VEACCAACWEVLESGEVVGTRRLEDRLFLSRWEGRIGVAEVAEGGNEISWGISSMLTAVG